MESYNTYKYITTATTTTFAGNELTKVILGSININKPLTGTLTVKSGSTTLAVFAASTPAGEYMYSSNGTVIESLNIVNGSTEDVTVFYRNI